MASAKSSRSRPAGHSGVFPVGGAALGVGAGGGGGGGGGGDGGVQLADKLKIFKTDNFDPDAYVQSKCQTMNEKVRQLSLPLSDPARGCARARSISICVCRVWIANGGIWVVEGACDRGSYGGTRNAMWWLDWCSHVGQKIRYGGINFSFLMFALLNYAMYYLEILVK
jgi:hypothetical protein